MKKYYFKIQFGFLADEYLTIDEQELPKAIGAFLNENSRLVVSSGAVRGKDIIRIIPNWHAEEGWNENHKMDTDDWNAISRKKGKYQKCYEVAKNYVSFLLKSKQEEFLKFPFSDLRERFGEIVENENALSHMSKGLSEKMKIPDETLNENERRDLLQKQLTEITSQKNDKK